jgi:regulator of sirC expression with transglutaminase-like and TPR domain
MNPDVKTVSSSFAEIKRSLDPSFSYLVFEKAMGFSNEAEFPEVTQVLSRLKKRVLGREIHCDEARGLLLLVVKLEPEQADKTMQEFLAIGLPKDITFYYYGKPIKSGG